jgi:hypothetical protein
MYMIRRLKLLRATAEERGAVLVVTVAVMASLLLIASYAIDTALWFVHRSHLQTQADAAALAGSQDFQFPCTSTVNGNIAADVNRYDGTGASTPPGTYSQAVNTQVYSTPTTSFTTNQTSSGHDQFSLLNSPTFAQQTDPPDADPLSGLATWSAPCTNGTVDVKMTETNLPSVLSILSPAYINAQARVSIVKQTTAINPSAFMEPLGNPDTVSAQIVNEDNSGAAVASTTLTQSTTNPYEYSGTATLPASVPTALLGTEVTLTGNNQSATYDSSATPPPYGIAYAHVWPTPSTSTTAPPQVSHMWLTTTAPCGSTPATGLGSDFISSSTSVTVYLCANLSFPSLTTSPACSSASFTLTENGNTLKLNCPTGGTNPNGTWQSDPVTLSSNSGPAIFKLTGWKLTAGSQASGACGDGKGQNPGPCTGTFTNDEQEAFMGAFDQASSQTSNSGSIVGVTLSDSTGNITSIQQSNPVVGGEQADNDPVTITVDLLPLQNETSITNSAPSELSFQSNQQNLAVDCNGNNSNGTLIQSIAAGCPGSYTVFTTGDTPCKSTAAPYCAGAASTGNKLIQNLTEGINDRVYCAGVSTGNCDTTVNANNAACPGDYNYWVTSNTLHDVTHQSPADPRLLTLFLTGFGNLRNGNSYEPISGFAEFYVTGWVGDPCLATSAGGKGTNGNTTSPITGKTLAFTTDDDPPGDTGKTNCGGNGNTNPACGVLMGHFVSVIQTTGGGSTLCTTNTFGNCVAVLTK